MSATSRTSSPFDSQATEDLWHTVETRLRQAITAALNGTALDSPARVTTLRHAAALHFVRNPQTLTIHNQSFADALKNGIDALASTSVAAEAFRQKYGLEPAGPEALRLGAEAVHGRLIKLHEEGGLFRLSVQRLFENVCDRFDTRGIQILTPASASKEFLLGDLPAITVYRATGAAGRAAGVTIDQADEILMPLTPRLLIILGPPNGTRAIPDHEVQLTQHPASPPSTRLLPHPPACSHLHGGHHHNLAHLTNRPRRPKTRVSTKAKKKENMLVGRPYGRCPWLSVISRTLAPARTDV